MVADWRDFASLVRYELKRSERYCSFVSLLSIALGSLDERLERKFPADDVGADCFVDQLFRAIKSAVRATDIVSSISRDRVGLLLVETPRDGAVVLAQRLRDHLSHFFDHAGKVTSGVDIRIEVGSFPDDAASIERMLRDFTS
jgi:GGDEF domain-containing protein